jgi:hypothetical protein
VLAPGILGSENLTNSKHSMKGDLMNPEKRRAAVKHGMAKLHARITPLRDELEILQRAYLRLLKSKWETEKEIVGITQIPIGMTKEKKEAEEKALAKRINKMSAEDASEMLAMLEAKLGGSE